MSKRLLYSLMLTFLTKKRVLAVLLYLSSLCLVTVNVLRIFLVVLWVGVPCVIVIFPDHTHFLFFLSRARGLTICLSHHLHPYFVNVISKGSEICRLTRTFVA